MSGSQVETDMGVSENGGRGLGVQGLGFRVWSLGVRV